MTTKHKVKEEQTQDMFNRVVLEARERQVLWSDAGSDFNPHLDQVKSEELRKKSTKEKRNYKNRKMNKD